LGNSASNNTGISFPDIAAVMGLAQSTPQISMASWPSLGLVANDVHVLASVTLPPSQTLVIKAGKVGEMADKGKVLAVKRNGTNMQHIRAGTSTSGEETVLRRSGRPVKPSAKRMQG